MRLPFGIAVGDSTTDACFYHFKQSHVHIAIVMACIPLAAAGMTICSLADGMQCLVPPSLGLVHNNNNNNNNNIQRFNAVCLTNSLTVSESPS